MAASRQPRSRLGIVSALALPLVAWGSAAARGQTRTFNLLNLCGETIWVGSQGIPPPATTGWALPSTACTSDSQCTAQVPSGASWSCNTAAGQCQLAVTVPLTLSRLWPMTDCDFDSTGLCPSSAVNCCATGGCETNAASPGTWGLNCVVGGQSPMTLVELSLSASAADNYDVSLEDGYNVAVEVTPGPGAAPASGNSYSCGNPGGPTSTTGLGGCTWNLLDATCNGNPALRVVDAAPCGGSNAACGGTSQCTGAQVCQCSQDSDCGAGQICGVGNNEVIGYLACGTFAGCTTPQAMCGIGQYLSYGPGGAPCCQGSDCASNTCCQGSTCSSPSGCINGTCTPSPADAFDCNQQYPTTIACNSSADCPVLVGILFATQQDCACPSPTICVQVPGSTPGSLAWGCQEGCVPPLNQPSQCGPGQNCTCAGLPCTSDANCSTLPNGTATGINMLCDLALGQCVSTNASLFEATGINGVSCYQPGATLVCGGCPASPPWPSLPSGTSCVSTNPNWVAAVQRWAAVFKQVCPTAYSFPYDDPTSLFTCQSTGSSNTLSYTVTFCPAAGGAASRRYLTRRGPAAAAPPGAGARSPRSTSRTPARTRPATPRVPAARG